MTTETKFSNNFNKLFMTTIYNSHISIIYNSYHTKNIVSTFITPLCFNSEQVAYIYK